MKLDDIAKLFSLDGKTALVSGGGSGIGLEIARCLGAAGAVVVIADRNAEAGEVAAEALTREGLDVRFRPVDIGDPSSVDALFAFLKDHDFQLDILVNNAAIFPKYPTLEITLAQWDELLAVTLRGTMLMSQAGVRMMQERGQGGRIINISSCSSLRTLVHGNVAYGAAKAGVNMLTKTYALEFATDGITVNAVLPGGVDTGGAKKVHQTYTVTGPITGAGRVPMGRSATPAEIATAVLYFASPAAGYVTGQLLAVDGGFLLS